MAFARLDLDPAQAWAFFLLSERRGGVGRRGKRVVRRGNLEGGVWGGAAVCLRVAEGFLAKSLPSVALTASHVHILFSPCLSHR